MEDILQDLLAEEAALQFDHFDEESAWDIGSWLVSEAREKKLPIAIDIHRGERQLFHAGMPGASASNDEWIKRKIRTVERFGHSSYFMGRSLAAKGKSLEEAQYISETEFAAHGGCFPILIKGTGMVGTITVSGLPQEEDHALVCRAISTYLGGKSAP